ncbi:hypothetical protein PUV47_17645 [Pseudovibrio exalbescens]|uniref:thermonuclease family protein n=1 Tax=Pseudovibrio exalbescens TaxID=197461 RepID=UPI002365490E|nr:hypothetical protein [Pseudovibrio exalbescens]MDD7911759.1 hypothetical protein [Pseudovibrio exalbescens]
MSCLRVIFLGLLAGLLFLSGSHAKEEDCSVLAETEVSALTVAPGDLLRAPSGNLYGLAGLKILDDRAAAALSAWLEGQSGAVGVTQVGKEDRWGVQAAFMRGADGTDLGGFLISQGLAVLWDPEEVLRCRKGLRAVYEAAENQARQQKNGWWGSHGPFLATDSRLYGARGSFQIVNGKVVSVGKTRRILYLNFGERWTRDFTGIIEIKKLKAFRGSGLDPEKLTGQIVEMRGIVQLRGGPEIRLHEPAALRLLKLEQPGPL